MQKFRTCFLILAVLLFCANAFGATTSPTPTPVYVSGGPFIYNVMSDGSLVKVYDATIGGVALTGNPYTGPYYSSLTVGPDNVDLGTFGNALYPFLIYACDNNTNTIIRFAPAGAVTTTNPQVDVVYNGGPSSAIKPVCGRFTSTGDFYVTNQSSTTATVYKFAGVANVKLGLLGSSSPTSVTLTGLASASANAGITQKNVGDLLLVDSVNNQVLRSPYGTPFSTASAFITNLISPLGIVRLSTGDIFVANTTPPTPTVSTPAIQVAHFSSNGSPATSCPSLSFPLPSGATNTNTSLFFLAASETDVIYAAASQPQSYQQDYLEDLDFNPETDYPGEVWSWSPTQGNCVFNQVALSETQLSGVTVAPIPTAAVSQPLTATAASPTPTAFSFNSNEFQIIAGSCTATVTANPLSLANINSMINLAETNPSGGLANGGTPIVNLGEGGYEIAYSVQWSGCLPVLSNGLIGDFIFGLYDPSLSSNPQIIQCDSNPADTGEPLLNGTNTCESLPLLGSYPLGGPIPNDNGAGGGGHTNSVFFLANANPNPVVAEQGQFCGFIPPNGTAFGTDGFVLVAFQLAQKTGNCKTGPFIGDAQVLLSVAEIAPFALVFPNTVGNLGTTFPEPNKYAIPCKNFPHSPLFCTYALIIDVHKSGLTPGTYELSAQPVTGNAGAEAVTFTVKSTPF